MAKKALEPAYKVDDIKFSRDDPPDLVESGVMLWCAESLDGMKFYGKTQAEAEKSRADYSKGK